MQEKTSILKLLDGAGLVAGNMDHKEEFKRQKTKTEIRGRNCSNRFIQRKNLLRVLILQDRKVPKKCKNGSGGFPKWCYHFALAHHVGTILEDFSKLYHRAPFFNINLKTQLRSSHAPNSAQPNDAQRSNRNARKEMDNSAKKARIISGTTSDIKSEEVNQGHPGRTKAASKGHTEAERGRKLERPKSIIKSSNKENLKGIRLNHKRLKMVNSIQLSSHLVQ